MNSYWPAIILSVLGHGLLIVLVSVGWSFTQKPIEVKPPAYIKATLVEVKPKIKPKAEVKKPKPPKQDNKKQRELEKKRQQKLAEKKRREAEQKRKNQLAKKKAEEKRKQQERERKAKERKEKERKLAEKKRREAAQREQAELEKQALAKSLAAEQARLEAELKAEQQAAEDAVTVQSYIAAIAAKVEQYWDRPASARNGMEATLRIHLVPTGQVVSVEIIRGSGNQAFDREAINAVKKAERFPELKNLPSRIFEKDFRVFTFTFSPEDLRQ